jgi:hypothetical protein
MRTTHAEEGERTCFVGTTNGAGGSDACPASPGIRATTATREGAPLDGTVRQVPGKFPFSDGEDRTLGALAALVRSPRTVGIGKRATFRVVDLNPYRRDLVTALAASGRLRPHS